MIDPSLLSNPVRAGNVISGWFWLSGRLQASVAPRASWLHKLTGGGYSRAPAAGARVTVDSLCTNCRTVDLTDC